jgi:hypothetical protein
MYSAMLSNADDACYSETEKVQARQKQNNECVASQQQSSIRMNILHLSNRVAKGAQSRMQRHPSAFV